ncbi:hypothetical protein B0A52_06121 [Exophiala mesophila]|uniref:Uncharacterized protein n=1 Tax=Exophiala mesophila TaxID=212818 RepID=A0A438N5L2_EXOME|nr:hypothetical protein B0A52_06121 [Exophiala mesophila]
MADSTSMGLRTLTAQVLTAPTTFPTAGYGGSYYRKVKFQVPTYTTTAKNHISWGLIDDYIRIVISNFSAMGIATGLAWGTLIYVLALTPNRKRTIPFHTFLLLGLVFLLIHLMIDLITACIPSLSKYPAYDVLTRDQESSIYTQEYRTIHMTSYVSNISSYTCASICLWLQARGLLTGVRVKAKKWYMFILAILILFSISAFSAQVAYLVALTQQLGKRSTLKALQSYGRYETAYVLTYAVGIGSHSLVAMCSIISIIWKRPASVVKGANAYASALNLVGLLCAQSFAVPFVFCVLTLIRADQVLIEPMVILLPTVFLILPLGTLFMTISHNDAEAHRDGLPQSPAPSPLRQKFLEQQNRSTTLTSGTDQTAVLGSSAASPSPHRRVWVQPRSPVDRELDFIDSMGHSYHESESTKIGSITFDQEARVPFRDVAEKE